MGECIVLVVLVVVVLVLIIVIAFLLVFSLLVLDSFHHIQFGLRFSEPVNRPVEVLGYAFPLAVRENERTLLVDDALLSGFPIPCDRRIVVLAHAFAVVIAVA